jgi:hypothetical protein
MSFLNQTKALAGIFSKPHLFRLGIFLIFAVVACLQAQTAGSNVSSPADTSHFLVNYHGFMWPYPANPVNVVKEYVAYDAEGTLPAYPPEAFWDFQAIYTDWDKRGIAYSKEFYNIQLDFTMPKIMVISGYKIGDVVFDKADQQSATIAVVYTVIGDIITIKHKPKFTRNETLDTAFYKLRKDGSIWRIINGERKLFILVHNIAKVVFWGEFDFRKKTSVSLNTEMEKVANSIKYSPPTANPRIDFFIHSCEVPNKKFLPLNLLYHYPKDPLRMMVAFLSSELRGDMMGCQAGKYHSYINNDCTEAGSKEIKQSDFVRDTVYLTDSIRIFNSQAPYNDTIQFQVEYFNSGILKKPGKFIGDVWEKPDLLFEKQIRQMHTFFLCKRNNIWFISNPPRLHACPSFVKRRLPDYIESDY